MLEYLRDWMLIMLWLQREAVPSWLGGSTQVYDDCMATLKNERSCAHLTSLYEAGTRRKPSDKQLRLLGLVRQAVTVDDPPLLVELPKSNIPSAHGKAVLFNVTVAGEPRARELVADLPEAGREAIKAELINQFHRRKGRKEKLT